MPDDLTIPAKIRKFAETNKLVFGREQTIKNLKRGTLSKVLLSANCPKDVVDEVAHYASLSSIEVVKLPQLNTELGIIFKRQFSISVVGVMQ